MPEDAAREQDQHARPKELEHRLPENAYGELAQPAPPGAQTLSTALLGDPRLNGRGNGSVREAAMLHAQQSYGNRAVQRLLQRQESNPMAPVTVPTVRAPAQSGAAGAAAEAAKAAAAPWRAVIARLQEALNATRQVTAGTSGVDGIQRAYAALADAEMEAQAVASSLSAEDAGNVAMRQRIQNWLNRLRTEMIVLLQLTGIKSTFKEVASVNDQIDRKVYSLSGKMQPPTSNQWLIKVEGPLTRSSAALQGKGSPSAARRAWSHVKVAEAGAREVLDSYSDESEAARSMRSDIVGITNNLDMELAMLADLSGAPMTEADVAIRLEADIAMAQDIGNALATG